MAQKTDAQLSTESDVIRNETATGANNEARIANMYQDIIDSKPNNSRNVAGHPLSSDITLVKGDVGLSNVDNTADANKPVSSAQATADAAALASAKSYADGLVVGLWDDRGNYDASGNTFPASGGSGTAGALLKGDIWTIVVAGILGGKLTKIGDSVRTLVDSPGQTSANWAIGETNIGYVPENAANKDASAGYVGLTLMKINFMNVLGTIKSFFTNSNTAPRNYTLQDRNGILADDTDISGREPALGNPSTNGYVLSSSAGGARSWVASGSGGPANTDALSEGSSNLYFTPARVLASVLTGLTAGSNIALAAGNSILIAFQNLQAQISAFAKNVFSEINTGTDDAKYTTALGLQNSKYLGQTLSKISGTTTGSANTYVLTLVPVAGTQPNIINFKINTTNTGASTINVSGLGAVALTKNGTAALVAGDLIAGNEYVGSFDGTQYQVIAGLISVISGAAGGGLSGNYPSPEVARVGGLTPNASSSFQIRNTIDNVHFSKSESFTGDGTTLVFTLKHNIFKFTIISVAGVVLTPYTDYYCFANTVNFVTAPIMSAKIVIAYTYIKTAVSDFAYLSGIVGQGGTAYVSIPSMVGYTVTPEWTFEFMFKPATAVAAFDGIVSNKFSGSGGYTTNLFYVGYQSDSSIFFARFVFYNSGGSIVANIPSEQYFLSSGSQVQNILFAVRFRRVGSSNWIFEIFENGLLYRSATVGSNPFSTFAQGLNFFTDGGTPSQSNMFDARWTERALSDEELFLNYRSGVGNNPQDDVLFHLKFDDVYSSGGNNYTSDSSGNGYIGQFNNFTTPSSNLVTYALNTTTIRVVFSGNSIVFGTAATTTVSLEFYRLLTDPKIFIKNIGVSGQTTTQMIAKDIARMDLTFDLSRSKNIYVFFEIGNDVNSGGQTASQAFANVKAWCNARKAANPTAKIILCTCTRRIDGFSGTLAGFNATIGTVNASILTDFNVSTADAYTWLPAGGITYADIVANIYARPNLVDATNSTYFASDGVHLKNPGQVEFATGVKNAYNLLP